MEPSGALSPSSASSANGNMGRCQRGTPNVVGFFWGVPWIGTGRVPSKQINRLREQSRTNHAAQCNKKEETRGIPNLGNTLVVKHNDTNAAPLTLQLKCANMLWGRTKTKSMGIQRDTLWAPCRHIDGISPCGFGKEGDVSALFGRFRRETRVNKPTRQRERERVLHSNADVTCAQAEVQQWRHTYVHL